VRALKEYWFDWKAYNPATGVYAAGRPPAPTSPPQAEEEVAAP
jgi:hypothetical protein